jgi:environmental stress-induced protein Ves
MIGHLTPAHYVTMPWANGRGQTVELIRVNRGDGSLLWRLSMASVVEDGPFSLFPGVERNLTVIEGPGFDLVGDLTLRADYLVPVAFPGDVALAAAGVTGPSQDFNVMTARDLPRPHVRVMTEGTAIPLRGAGAAIFALAPARAGEAALQTHDLILTDSPTPISGGPVIVVALNL